MATYLDLVKFAASKKADDFKTAFDELAGANAVELVQQSYEDVAKRVFQPKEAE